MGQESHVDDDFINEDLIFVTGWVGGTSNTVIVLILKIRQTSLHIR